MSKLEDSIYKLAKKKTTQSFQQLNAVCKITSLRNMQTILEIKISPES